MVCWLWVRGIYLPGIEPPLSFGLWQVLCLYVLYMMTSKTNPISLQHLFFDEFYHCDLYMCFIALCFFPPPPITLKNPVWSFYLFNRGWGPAFWFGMRCCAISQSGTTVDLWASVCRVCGVSISCIPVERKWPRSALCRSERTEQKTTCTQRRTRDKVTSHSSKACVIVTSEGNDPGPSSSTYKDEIYSKVSDPGQSSFPPELKQSSSIRAQNLQHPCSVHIPIYVERARPARIENCLPTPDQCDRYMLYPVHRKSRARRQKERERVRMGEDTGWHCICVCGLRVSWRSCWLKGWRFHYNWVIYWSMQDSC